MRWRRNTPTLLPRAAISPHARRPRGTPSSLLLPRRSLSSSSSTPSSSTSSSPSTKSKWVPRADPVTNKVFYYNTETFESRDSLEGLENDDVATTKKEYRKPEYSTDWKDERFPNYVQFLELNTKRPYYWNLDDGKVSWAPPSDPNYNVFEEEIARMKKGLTPVSARNPPETIANATLARRLAATGIDIALASAFGLGFGGLVYLDLYPRLNDAAPAVGFAGWFAFLARDSIFEMGTRSPGKRLMGLEIVTWKGTLPSRWNTAFRQAYLPLYAGSIFLMPWIMFLPVVELGCVLFTPQGYRLGDVIGRTRVIMELPDRSERMAEKKKKDEEDDMRD